MSKAICLFAFCLTLYATQSSEALRSRTEESAVQENPRYSAAVARGLSALAELETRENELHLRNTRESPEWYRFGRLPYAAKAALEAGDNVKAAQYANEALTFIDAHPFPVPNEHTATGQERLRRMYVETCKFYCNLVLGRLAILDGNIDRAAIYLIAAGKTEGDGVLHTFGPNMSLARELLKRGKQEVVLTFLDECKTFWKTEYSSPFLDDWIAVVKAGGMPTFGGNLYH